MGFLGSFVIALFIINSANTESVTVTDTDYPTCKTYYLSRDEELDIYYYGASLGGECAIKVDSFGTKDLCITAVSFEIPRTCQVEVEYFKYTGSSSPEKDYDCNDNSPGTWCSGKSEIKIVISRHGWGSQIGHNIHLKVSQKDSDLDDIISSAVTITYAIVGAVIGGIVLISVIVTIVICCVCNKRRATRGTVYQNGQQVPNQVPIGAYPTVASTTYPQAGVYPQAGYQPAAQTGYQPGYQPPPQAAGYQMTPNMEYKPASAPPVEPVQPPPYPGN